uniref:Uncharacterized protein n=1 Tax=Prymnesium polylepis TaxID=72548 RepID=A0A6T8AKP4_9EUKA|mmetsp:Transcript_33788/g.84547  ORF Transcript_33788/g.84547 Transcript_33788/m.84547 type:complete len:157 (+) Transcript_33788:23-493(+)|eukprot:2491077-Prymnesium_polylepis.1
MATRRVTRAAAARTEEEGPDSAAAPEVVDDSLKEAAPPQRTGTSIRTAVDHMLAGGVDPADFILNGDASSALKRKAEDVVSAPELLAAWDNYKQIYGTNSMAAGGAAKIGRRADADAAAGSGSGQAADGGCSADTACAPMSEAERRAADIRAAFMV